jgi:uncharacterized membrane protein
MIETHTRTLVKIVSFRVIAMLITAVWTGIADAILIHIVLTIVHYAFERLWLKINWGVKNGTV